MCIRACERAAAESAREAAVHRERWRQAQVCDVHIKFVYVYMRVFTCAREFTYVRMCACICAYVRVNELRLRVREVAVHRERWRQAQVCVRACLRV